MVAAAHRRRLHPRDPGDLDQAEALPVQQPDDVPVDGIEIRECGVEFVELVPGFETGVGPSVELR